MDRERDQEWMDRERDSQDGDESLNDVKEVSRLYYNIRFYKFNDFSNDCSTIVQTIFFTHLTIVKTIVQQLFKQFFKQKVKTNCAAQRIQFVCLFVT